jgi:hypothetical protein
MEIKFNFTKRAKIQGWCRGKAIAIIDINGERFWVESPSPENHNDVFSLNTAFEEIEKRVNAYEDKDMILYSTKSPYS